MKEKNDAPKPFPELGCIGLIIVLVITCFAAFNVGIENPYSTTARFDKVYWSVQQQTLFFSRTLGYRVYGLHRDGQLTCESEDQIPENVGRGGVYEDGTVITSASEPIAVWGAPEPLPNFRLIVTREGDDPIHLSVDRHAIDAIMRGCDRSVIQLVPMAVILIAGLVVGCVVLLRFRYRYRALKVVMLVIYVGVILFCVYMGYEFSVLRATFTGFD